MQMEQKYFRVVKSGAILPWSERLLGNPEVIQVSEKDAFPERFTDVDVKARMPKVSLEVPKEVTEAPVEAPAELRAQRGKTFSANPPVSKAKAQAFDAAGLAGEI